MPKMIKHVGKIKSTDEKVLIVFRTIPGESNYSLVVRTNTLEGFEHDAIMTLVESEQAQDAFEFGEILSIRPFPNGTMMLVNLHASNRLARIPTTDIVVTPTTSINETVSLSDLNIMIAEQKNCAVDELCNFVSGSPKTEVKDVAQVKDLGRDVGEPKNAPKSLITEQTNPNSVLNDKDLARNLRSQADSLYKEAARMRKEADSLDPPQKKTVKGIAETVAVKETENA
jgi:hypothetical protein